MRLATALITVLLACAPAARGNDTIADAFARHVSGIEVTADGTVERLLTDAPGPDGTHERFIVRLDGGAQTVLVDHNVTIAPRVPLSVGGHVTVHGEYVWNPEGGLVHFTHHDPVHTHEDGYILYGGTRYSARRPGRAA